MIINKFQTNNPFLNLLKKSENLYLFMFSEVVEEEH